MAYCYLVVTAFEYVKHFYKLPPNDFIISTPDVDKKKNREDWL